MRMPTITPLGYAAIVGVGVLGYAMWHASSTKAMAAARNANYPAWTAGYQPPENTLYQTLDEINPEATRVKPTAAADVGSRWLATTGNGGASAMCLSGPCQWRTGMSSSFAPFASWGAN